MGEAEKHRIVAKSCLLGVSVALVALRNDVNANQAFIWGRQWREQGGCLSVDIEPDRPPHLERSVTLR